MAFARKRDTMRPGQQLTQLEGPLLAQTGRSASAGVGYSRVEANLKRNLDDVPVVETDGAECGEKVIDVRFQFLGELGGNADGGRDFSWRGWQTFGVHQHSIEAFVLSQRDRNATQTTSGLGPISRQSCPINAKSDVDLYLPELRARLEM